MKYIALLVISLTFFFSCQENKENTEKEQEKKAQNKDPLPSWNNGENKKRITSFVENAVNENSESFIPVEDRIATFDNDGTLWAENPVYFQLIFAFDRIKEMGQKIIQNGKTKSLTNLFSAMNMIVCLLVVKKTFLKFS